MENRRQIGGIKIQTFNYIMILLACVLYGFLIYETIQINTRYNSLSKATEDHVRCEQLATMVISGSDTLTEQARLYVVTGDVACAEAYFKEADVDRNRDIGLEEMELYHPNDKVLMYLQEALRHSNDLMKREIEAMAITSNAFGYEDADLPERLRGIKLSEDVLALSQEEKLHMAQDMMLGDGYRDAKELIQNNVDYCMNSILEYTERARAESSQVLGRTIRQQRVCITLLFVMTVAIFFFITVLIIRPLQIYIKCIGDNRMLEIIGSYEFKYLALTYNDIYELNAANEVMLRKQAERDGLTDLLNRASFDRLQTTLRDYPIPVALLLIDVDKFKTINDTYGHAAGDLALKRVARLLTDSFRTSDFVSRIGGDEFSVVMTDVDSQGRIAIEAKVAELNRRLQTPEPGVPVVTLSIGVAFSNGGFDEGLFKRADAALYVTKERGRCGVCFYEEGMETK